MASNDKYGEYLDIDQSYFPCIDEDAIKNGAPWKNTYPHETFIDMLTQMELALAHKNDHRTLWIDGAFGSGKSQCAYAMRKILEVPEDELREYWNKYEPLKKKTDLLEKLIGHKRNGIVVAHRYAAGGIKSVHALAFAIQESVKSALVQQKVSYLGENTLKDSIIVWLEDTDHKKFFDGLLKNPQKKWIGLFSQSTADEVLNALRKKDDVKTLVENIFCLADEEGISALTIDSDRLKAWLTDIIDSNKISIVLIWDEFSDYFTSNPESLSEFQSIIALVQNKPFYFIVITHEPQQIYVAARDRVNTSKLSDRFVPISITLPDNIAFDLIGHAFKAKSAAKSQWDTLAEDLNARIKDSRDKVMTVANIDKPQVVKDIMPIHPMAALLLKNIATALKSNQRSIFSFISSSDSNDVKAFRWFIENTGPHDDHPLLTVDMLWNFLYETNRDKLPSDIRVILDTYPQQQNLREDEKSVLKAVLIMQAVDQRLGGTIDLFKATEQNLSYVFEGIPSLEGTKSANLAKGLKDRGILVANPINGGRYAYSAAVLAGDQAKIDNFKNDIRQNSTTAKLVTEGGLSTVLSLPPALRLRFESEPGTGKITPITITDFTRTINSLRDKAPQWNFQAVIAFAKDDTEAAAFRKAIRETIADKQYENIVFIDALSTPLGLEAFERYADFSAMAMYYRGSNNASAQESTDKAKRILDQDWKIRVYNGHVIVYNYKNYDGEKLGNAIEVASVLQRIVTNRFPHTQEFDFARGLTENHNKLTQGKNSALYGVTGITKSSPVNGIEKILLPTLLPTAWKADKYWENPMTASLSISKIKVETDNLIMNAFNIDGYVSIGKIYDFLEETYGFAPCNLSAFITGFLLKEYGCESFRYSDSANGSEQMTPDKLAEMLGNYIGKSLKPKPTYIVKMTADEMAFYELTEKAWGISANSCSSVGQAAKAVVDKMRSLNFPVWCLEEENDTVAFDMVRKYIELVQEEDEKARKIAVEIGKIASAKPSLAESLPILLTRESCQNAMLTYLHSFDDGKVMELVNAIGAENEILSDIRRLFGGVKYSCLWDKRTGEDEIRKLQTEYGVVKESNSILNTTAHSLAETYEEWRNRVKFIGISCEALRATYPALAGMFEMLLKIYKQEDILPEQMSKFYSELVARGADVADILNNDKRVFAEVYEPYIRDLSDNDVGYVKNELHTGLFELSKTDCNVKVKEAAEAFRKKQLKTQIVRLWYEKTQTRTPRDWSHRYRTPILCCVSGTEFERAKKAFEILNHNIGTDAEIKEAITFFETTTLFDELANADKRNAAFKRDILGDYSPMLPDLDHVREILELSTVDTCDWRDHPSVKGKVKQLAEEEYNAGGSDKVIQIIDKMDDTRLKQYLKRLIEENIKVGMEILAKGGGE